MHGNFGQGRYMALVEDLVGSLGGNCMYRDWPSERKNMCGKEAHALVHL